MKKRLLTFVLMAAMSVSLLIGCGGDSDRDMGKDLNDDSVVETQEDEQESEEEISQLGTSRIFPGESYLDYNVKFTYNDSMVTLESETWATADLIDIVNTDSERGITLVLQEEYSTAQECYLDYKAGLESTLGETDLTVENFEFTECIPWENEYDLSIYYFEYHYDMYGDKYIDEWEEWSYIEQYVFYRWYVIEASDGLVYTCRVGSESYGWDYTEEDHNKNITSTETILKSIISIEKEAKPN